MRRDATYGCLTRAAILAAVTWAALSPSSQAGQGGPAGEPLVSDDVGVRVTTTGVAVNVANAVAVKIPTVGAAAAGGGAPAVEVFTGSVGGTRLIPERRRLVAKRRLIPERRRLIRERRLIPERRRLI